MQKPYKTIFVIAPKGHYTKDGLQGGSSTKQSDTWVDGDDLAWRCEEACNGLDAEGYEVISLTEVTKGHYMTGASGGAGWSLTHGILITGRRYPENQART